MAGIIPVIMAGGSGTRLWPMSRAAEPKQFQSLVSERTMLEETLSRVAGDAFAGPVVIGGARHVDVIDRQLGGDDAQIVLEPFGRNTGPAAIVAALLGERRDKDALVLLLPADHHIADPQAFCEAVSRGAEAARDGYLVTLGISPDGPETGYGYIKAGNPLTDHVFKVERFIEKPRREVAERFLEEGGYSWNAGIFLFRASDLLAEAEAHAADMLTATKAAFTSARTEGRIIRLQEADFDKVPSDSIDYAIMEKTSRAAVVSPVTIGWNDIGSWAAVKAFAKGDAAGEGAIAIDCPNTLIKRTDDAPHVSAVGLDGFVVVATKDSVLIVPENRAQEVKTIVETLKKDGRTDLL